MDRDSRSSTTISSLIAWSPFYAILFTVCCVSIFSYIRKVSCDYEPGLISRLKESMSHRFSPVANGEFMQCECEQSELLKNSYYLMNDLDTCVAVLDECLDKIEKLQGYMCVYE